jgi:hypothetical protein
MGIPAIVYAAQVNSKVLQGDIAGARHSSKNARMWCWIAFGFGLAVQVIWAVFNFFLLMSPGHLRRW